jgi:hypothetical protein
MKTLKTISCILAVLAMTLPAVAKDKVLVGSQWTSAPIKIDGAKTEWDEDALVEDKDLEISYGFKNDPNFLYLLLAFNSPKSVSTIDGTGLTLWIDAEGKDKKTYGLKFTRKMISADELIENMTKQGQTLSDEQIMKIKATRQYRTYACDPIDKKGKSIAHPGPGTGTFRLARVEKTTTYECIIPLTFLQDPSSQTQWDSSAPLSVGFEWGGITEAMKKARTARNFSGASSATAGAATSWEQTIAGGGEGGGGGEEGGGGVGMEGGMGGRGGGTPKKIDFWVNLKIAPKQ